MNCDACGHPHPHRGKGGSCLDCSYFGGPCYPWEFR